MEEIRLDKTSKKKVFQQIADQIHFQIITGQLAQGQKLPGLREMARQTKTAVNTMVKALNILIDQGIIVSQEKSGYRVIQQGGEENNRYAQRGVSSAKTEVHNVVDHLDRGIFPGAFCKISEDYLTKDPDRCIAIHADGSGTKSSIAYLSYRESGDPAVFRGIAQDSIVMNLDDLICIGAVENIMISSTINRNSFRCPQEVLAALICGNEDFLATLRDHGVNIFSGGGETADVGDLTSTVVVDSCAVVSLKKSQVISAQAIRPGLVIVGLASFGQASYEKTLNSGIGSNGLTSAKHDLLSAYYRERYPETYDQAIDSRLVYCGPWRLEDKLPGSTLTVGEALLSPTRTYAPVLSKILKSRRDAVKGFIHCSGGGQTKCLRFGQDVHYMKDNLFDIPPIFMEIQRASNTSWPEMYRVFNMGHRMEIYCEEKDADFMIKTAESLAIQARIIGRVEPSRTGNQMTIAHDGRVLKY